MPIDTNAIINLINDLMSEREIQVTAVQSMKGAFITGGCAFLGGILAGPVGLAIGGASGGALAAYNSKATFKPIGQILSELPYEKKEQIAADIQGIIDKLEINDLTQLIQIAAVCQTLAQPDRLVLDIFVQRALPVLQRHLQYQ